jgi:hypothetical protein
MLGDKSRPVARGILSITEVIRQRLSELEEQNEPVGAERASIGKK